MKKILMSLISIASLNAAVIIEASDNSTLNVNLSNTSVNRIVLPSDVKDVAFSQEKNMAVNIKGNQVFIKFNPTKRKFYTKPAGAQPNVGNKDIEPDRSEILYDAKEPVDLYLITENATYSLNVIPKKIAQQTVIITNYAKSAKEVIKYETENTYVKTLSKLSTSIFKNMAPSGYRLYELNKKVDEKFALKTTLLNKYKGVLYGAYLFEVENKTSTKRTVDIKNFFDYVEEKPLAISVFYDNEYNELLPHDKARVVFIFRTSK